MGASQTLSVIVLAAGKGTRLCSELPKVLHPLMQRPLLDHVLSSVEQASLPIGQACVVVGHQAQPVTAFLNERQNITTAWHPVLQSPQLGTGHALQTVAKAVSLDDCVFLLSGDVPLLQAQTLHQLKKDFDRLRAQDQVAMVVVGAPLDDPTGYGRLIQSPDGSLQAIVEEKDATPEQRHIKTVNAGIYAFHWPTVAPWLNELSNNNAQNELYVTDLVGLARQKNCTVGVFTLTNPHEMLGVNSRADLAHCHQELNRRTTQYWMNQGVTIIDPTTTWISPEVVHIGMDTVIEPHCHLLGAISIGNACLIGANTQLRGNVTIGHRTTVTASVVSDSTLGDDCTIGPFAHLRNQTVVANQVRIGNFVEVKQTTIGHSTNAAHLSYLGNAVLGDDVNIGAGTIIANYDPIRKIKHTTHIGNSVKVGCNSVLVAPVTVGTNACVAAGTVVTKTVDPEALAIARPEQKNIKGWVQRTLNQLLAKASQQ
ncbi:MAG: bifunctional UDP-N-acetylglucosamine diphosphorylase/glucosamine-1-phosphate N-acetyltransferase GlmU [Vampirovibrionales bacterium]